MKKIFNGEKIKEEVKDQNYLALESNFFTNKKYYFFNQ